MSSKQPTLDDILEVLETYKAQDIVPMSIANLTDLADSMVICSATSSQHAHTLSRELKRYGKSHLSQAPYIEGEDTPDWIVVDFGDIIVHVMLSATREYYQLEKLWQDMDLQHDHSD